MTPAEYRKLSSTEQTAFDALLDNKITSFLAESIDNHMRGSADDFRRLLQQLYSQGLDYPKTMIRIIGKPAWDMVVQCAEGVEV